MPVTGVLTAADRAAVVADLESSAQRLEAAILACPAQVWNQSPREGAWSAAGVAEHIITSEISQLRLLESFLSHAQARECTDHHRRFDDVIRERVPDRTPGKPRVEAPEALRPTGRYSTPESALAAFRKYRGRMLEFARTTELPLRFHTVEHPVFGQIDGCQWMIFAAAHTRRHTAQLEEASKECAG